MGTGSGKTNPHYLGVSASTKMTILNSGNVGIGTTNPQAKLQVTSSGEAIHIEDDLGKGRLGFVQTGESDARVVFYRGGSASPDPSKQDVTILRNFPPASLENDVLHTLLQIWAPRINDPNQVPAPSTDREATLSLVRDLTYQSEADQEFMDVYNNGYSGETQCGIRIQKRGTGSYRNFVIDKYAGSGSKVVLVMVKTETGNVGIGNSSPNFVLHTSSDAVALGAPSTAPSDSNLNNSNISFWVDEANNTLKVRVKYSNGTLKTATVALA